MKKLYFVTQYFIQVVNFIAHIILHGYGLQYNTRSTLLLSRRKTSFYAIFQVHCSHCFPVFTWLCYVLSGLSVKQEVKELTTNYISIGRKPVYLQILSSLVLRLVSFAFS